MVLRQGRGSKGALFLLSLLPSTLAQLPSIPPSSLPSNASSSSESEPASTRPSTTSHTWVTQTTTYTHLTNLPTLTFPVPTTTSDPTIPGLPPTTGSYGRPPTTSENDLKRDNLVNLYFVFLILLGVILAGLVWLLYRRRQQRVLAARTGRTRALEQDLGGERDGWWGGLLGGRGRGRWAWRARSEGEEEAPPPPYVLKQVDGEGVGVDAGKPPDYQERDTQDTQDSQGSGSTRDGGDLERSGAVRGAHTNGEERISSRW